MSQERGGGLRGGRTTRCNNQRGRGAMASNWRGGGGGGSSNQRGNSRGGSNLLNKESSPFSIVDGGEDAATLAKRHMKFDPDKNDLSFDARHAMVSIGQ